MNFTWLKTFVGKEGDEKTFELEKYVIPNSNFDQGIFPDLDELFLTN